MARTRLKAIPDEDREALRDAMAELGISQNAAARKLGLSQPTVRAWLTGETALTHENADKLMGVISAQLAVTFTTAESIEARLQKALSWTLSPQPPTSPATKRRAKGK